MQTTHAACIFTKELSPLAHVVARIGTSKLWPVLESLSSVSTTTGHHMQSLNHRLHVFQNLSILTVLCATSSKCNPWLANVC